MTAPSVIYKVNLTDGEALDVSNPSEFPDPTKIASIEEPYVKAQIMVPQEFVAVSYTHLVKELKEKGQQVILLTNRPFTESLADKVYYLPINETSLHLVQTIDQVKEIVKLSSIQ